MQQYDYPMGLRDYWTILLRRKWHFLLPTLVVVMAALSLAFMLPPTYRSESTILIERQTIPANLVASTVTSYVQEQIQQIRQRIVTHENLREIARDFQLYPDEIASDPSGVMAKLREQIQVQMVDVQAADPDRAGTRVATIAFTVAFEADDPNTAQAVTAELADRFLTYNKVSRQEQGRRSVPVPGAGSGSHQIGAGHPGRVAGVLQTGRAAAATRAHEHEPAALRAHRTGH